MPARYQVANMTTYDNDKIKIHGKNLMLIQVEYRNKQILSFKNIHTTSAIMRSEKMVESPFDAYGCTLTHFRNRIERGRLFLNKQYWAGYTICGNPSYDKRAHVGTLESTAAKMKFMTHRNNLHCLLLPVLFCTLHC